MTTFQYIIDAILSALSLITPIPSLVTKELYKSLLKWPASSPETQLLVTLVGSTCLLFYFRYDWLGLFSALIKSIIRPMSLKAETRTLDQQTTLFLLLILIPSLLSQRWLLPLLSENEHIMNPLLSAGVFFVISGILHFAANWNKRMKGLNHIRLIDGLLIGGITLFSAHPAVSLVFALWTGFALTNYHYETLFKYIHLVLGVHIICRLFGLLGDVSLTSALSTIGHLNGIAVLAISATTFWLTLENLQKNMNENMLKVFKWFSILFGLFFIAIYFI